LAGGEESENVLEKFETFEDFRHCAFWMITAVRRDQWV
jgi:hypothetical protein